MTINQFLFFSKFLEEILICFEEELWMLTSRFLQWNLWIQDTYGLIVLSAIQGMSAIWDISYWEVSLYLVLHYVHALRLVNLFLSVTYKDFLHWFGCSALHCFLETCLINSSILKTKEVQRLIMIVGLINVFLLSCQLYNTYETFKHCVLQQRKKLCISILISLLMLIRNISKHHFSGRGVLLNSIMGIPCSKTEEWVKFDGCRCKGRGVERFSLCVGHKWMEG